MKSTTFSFMRILHSMIFVCILVALFCEPGYSVEMKEDSSEPIRMRAALSAPSVKNGGTLSVQAVIRAAHGVKNVEARIQSKDDPSLAPVDTFFLKPSPRMEEAGLEKANIQIWEAEWKARDLCEGYYNVILTITDKKGNTISDRSLSFSDPIAGNNTPGTNSYPEGGIRRLDSLKFGGEDYIKCAVIDTKTSAVLFGTDTSPGRVIKVDILNFIRIGCLTLEPGEDNLRSAVIDSDAGYAYFGTGTDPGIVVKVALGSRTSTPTRVGAVTLQGIEESDLRCAVIDPEEGYAYFGSYYFAASVIKIALGVGAAPPTRIGSIMLDLGNGENFLHSAVIDTDAGYAWFGTSNDFGFNECVIKVSLGEGANLPSRIGAVTLEAGEYGLQCATIDTSAGFAYFGTQTEPGKIVKIALGVGANPPSRVDVLTLDEMSFEWYPSSAVFDPENGFAYFRTGFILGQVIKVDVASTFTKVGNLTLGFEDDLQCAVIDPHSGFAYFGSYLAPGNVRKIDLSDFTLDATLNLDPGNVNFTCAVIDELQGYAYFGTGTIPSRIVKVRLSDMTHINTVNIDSDDGHIKTGVIDPEAGYAYFGTDTSPGVIVKLQLGAGDANAQLIDSMLLSTGENNLQGAVIDTEDGYAYFGTHTNPAKVVKIRLSDFSRLGAETLDTGENKIACCVIDPGENYAWFGLYRIPGRIVKVSLGEGDNLPTRLGTLTLETGENYPISGVIDPEAGYAWFGTETTPGRVVKVALGEGVALPTRIDAVTLNSGEKELTGSIIDPEGGFACFGTRSNPGRIVKVSLGQGDEPPTRVGRFQLDTGQNIIQCGVYDSQNSLGYFGNHNNSPGYLIKASLSQKGYVKATKFTMAEQGTVTDVNFYSHGSTGTLQLGLYSDESTKNLLWESGIITNTANEDVITVPIGSGTPSSLELPLGEYWLAWQVDTTAPVPSYSAGAGSSGFYTHYSYNSFPSSLDSVSTTDENWTEYINYVAPTPTPTPTVTPVLRFESGVASGVDTSFQTVNLNKPYFNPVVIASVNYGSGARPIITRIDNVNPNSFDVKLQNPGDQYAVTAKPVHYFVIEEGNWTMPDGRKIEAHKYQSTVTDYTDSWIGESQIYGNSYTNPVVIGQVMSHNDSDFSVFWCCGPDPKDPPTTDTLLTGKTVCGDTNQTRIAETVGYIVIEQGTGAIGGVEYEAALGEDIVMGVTNTSPSPPYNYTFTQSFDQAPETAVISLNAMDGNDGGWAFLFVGSPLSQPQISLCADEDQIGDTERNHTHEQVAYLVFETAVDYEKPTPTPTPTPSPTTTPSPSPTPTPTGTPPPTPTATPTGTATGTPTVTPTPTPTTTATSTPTSTSTATPTSTATVTPTTTPTATPTATATSTTTATPTGTPTPPPDGIMTY